MNDTQVTYKAYLFVRHNEHRTLLLPEDADPVKYCVTMNFQYWKPIELNYFKLANWN